MSVLLKRGDLMRLIPFSAPTTYVYFPATRSGMISSDAILATLRDAACNGQTVGEWIPKLCTIRDFGRNLKYTSRKRALSVSTVRRMIARGMPHFRLGRKILLDDLACRDWLGLKAAD